MNRIWESFVGFFSIHPKSPETVEDLEAATQEEEARAIELEKVLEAKKKLAGAKQRTRELSGQIESMGKPKPARQGMTKPGRI